MMPTQPKPLADISTTASDIGVPSTASGTAAPVCMTSRTNLSIAPSRPPGCSLPKSSAVKPRLSSSATASASPSAACISVEVVGARLCGQASRACGNSEHDVGGRAERAVGGGGDRDEPDAEAARIVDQVLELGGLARP